MPTLSRKLTQTEDPGQRPHHLEGHGGGKHETGLVAVSVLGKGTKRTNLLKLSTRDKMRVLRLERGRPVTKDVAHLYIQSIHYYHEMTPPIEYLEDGC